MVTFICHLLTTFFYNIKYCKVLTNNLFNTYLYGKENELQIILHLFQESAFI